MREGSGGDGSSFSLALNDNLDLEPDKSGDSKPRQIFESSKKLFILHVYYSLFCKRKTWSRNVYVYVSVTGIGFCFQNPFLTFSFL